MTLIAVHYSTSPSDRASFINRSRRAWLRRLQTETRSIIYFFGIRLNCIELRHQAKTRAEKYAEDQRMSQFGPSKPPDHNGLRPFRKPHQATEQNGHECNPCQSRQPVGIVR